MYLDKHIFVVEERITKEQAVRMDLNRSLIGETEAASSLLEGKNELLKDVLQKKVEIQQSNNCSFIFEEATGEIICKMSAVNIKTVVRGNSVWWLILTQVVYANS